MVRLIVLSLSLTAAFATSARAQTGVVLRFSGPDGAQARNAAVRGLRDADLERIDRVEDVARDLDVSLDSRRGRADIARELRLDFFVDGRVTGRGRSGRTVLRIYDASGRELETSTARRPIGAAGRGDITRRAGRLLEEIDTRRSRDRRDDRRASRDDRDDRDDRYDDRDRRRSRDRDDDRDYGSRDRYDDRDEDRDRYDRRGRERDDRRGRYDDAEDEEVEERGPEDYRAEREAEAEETPWYADDENPRDAHPEEDVEEETPRGPIYVPRASLRVGVDGRTRNTAVTLTDGRRRNFDAPLYPELTIRIETHPLADREGALRGIYADLELDFALRLQTMERDPSNPEITTPIGARAWRFMVNAGYLAILADDKIRIGPVLGFGHDRFELGQNQTLPGSAYSQFRVGAVASFAAYEGRMVTRIDLGYRFLLGAGALADAFGSETSGGAYDGGLSVGGGLPVGFTYGLRVGYTRYNIAFGGEAADAEGESASDGSLNVGISLGWVLR